EITLFNPIRPMLAKRLDIHEIPKALGGKTFWMEEKLDGERIQLHKAGDKFAYYSRRAIDYTHLYGESKDEGSLTPYIYNLFNYTDSCILDGEMLAYNPIYDAFMQFGTLKTAASDMFDDPEKPRPCFVVFDVIMLNNKPLNKQKYSKRREILTRMINPVRGHLELMSHKEGNDKKDLYKALESAIQEG
ncbi:4210_t:CDS:2, partial [Paraglomus occultum]